MEQQLKLGFGLGVAWQNEQAPIAGGHMHINHVEGLEFFDHAAGRQPGGMAGQKPMQAHVQAIGQKSNEDVRLNALLELVVDRA